MKFKTILAALLAFTSVCAGAERIAVLSDIHVTPGNACDSMLRIAVDEINAGDFDFVVLAGDLSNEGSDDQLRNVKEIMDAVRHPLFVLPGNHENNWSQSATKTFVDLWGNDRFFAEFDSLVIVGINCGPFMKMGDGHIKQEDLHWLRSTLANATPGKRILNFNHYPILPDDLDNWGDYLEVLEDFPVIAHINGHYHSWRAYNAGGDDQKGTLPAIMVRALDMRNNNYGYSVIELEPEWIKVYDKQLGSTAKPKLAVPATTKHRKAKRPDRPEIVAPEGFEVTKVWTDSASIFTRLGFDQANVYFGNSLGQARAVSKTDGSMEWSVPTGASLFARPVTMNGKVAVPMHDGIMMLDAKSGKLLRKESSKEGPYVADGTLTPDGKGYIQGGYKRIERRNPKNGKLIWSYDSLFNYCQAAPAIDGSDLIFGAWDTNLRNLDLNTGKLRWVWNNGKTANMLGPGNVVPVISGERVFIVAPDRYMTALDRATGRQLWRNNDHRYRESLGHSADGSRVYAKTMDGELVVVDATAPEFKEIATIDMGLGYDHAPCIVAEQDGVIYAGSRHGEVVLINAETLTPIARLPLGKSEVNGIDIDPVTGDVYASLIEGTIFKINKK